MVVKMQINLCISKISCTFARCYKVYVMKKIVNILIFICFAMADLSAIEFNGYLEKLDPSWKKELDSVLFVKVNLEKTTINIGNGDEPALRFQIRDVYGENIQREWFCKGFRSRFTRCPDFVYSLYDSWSTEGWILFSEYTNGEKNYISFAEVRNGLQIYMGVINQGSKYRITVLNSGNLFDEIFNLIYHQMVESGTLKVVSCDELGERRK